MQSAGPSVVEMLDPSMRIRASTLYSVMDLVRRHESIYKVAGAVHGCALASMVDDDEVIEGHAAPAPSPFGMPSPFGAPSPFDKQPATAGQE